jgi:hypothetical protein
MGEIGDECFDSHKFQTFISRKAAKSPRESKTFFSWFSLRLGVLSEQRERA